MKQVHTFAATLLLTLSAVQTLPAQQAKHAAASASSAAPALTIQLEQFRGGKVVPVRPDHVFAADDYLRFRLQTRSHAYLYVVDQGSSGMTSVLFPSAATQASNEVGNEPEAFVPSPQDGWFQVGGPPGFDTVYFLLSPTPTTVSENGSGASDKTQPPSNLMPRCNDAIFQARGECVDSNAGPTPLPRGATLPPQITTAAPQASRDLFLTDEKTGTVRPPAAITAPTVYAFRIAHK